MLQSTVQAAPTQYRFDGLYRLFEYLEKPDGTITQLGAGDFLIPYGTPLSIDFSYDADVALTPLDMPEDTSQTIYGDGFWAEGAITNVFGKFGADEFGADSTRTALYSLQQIPPEGWAGGPQNQSIVNGIAGTFGTDVFGSGLRSYSFVRAGETFTLTNFALLFYASRVDGVLPADLNVGFDLNTQVRFYFAGDAGSGLDFTYLGGLTEVPVPGALWLFGSSLLTPVVLRLRKTALRKAAVRKVA
jgi:hypothetical protein